LVDELQWNEERKVFEMFISGRGDGKEDALISGLSDETFTPVKIGRGLIYSSAFQKCLILGKKIFKHDFPPFMVYHQEKEEEQVTVKDKIELLDIFMRDAKKGMNIQRYKGLGEMNPEQLWETTMNPEKRMLLQVKVEDMMETDEIFTILMGEEVEPRKEFIQSNALEVSTLDI
jgi:DNA gyrase subunit B